MFDIEEFIKDKGNDILDKIYYITIVVSSILILAGLLFVTSYNICKNRAVTVTERSELELLVTSYVGKTIDGEMLEILSENNDMEIVLLDKSILHPKLNYTITGCTDSVLYVRLVK